jgi:hypothetical protein
LGIKFNPFTSNFDFDSAAGAFIPLAEKGANNGVAELDGGGKVPVSQLPNSIMQYKSLWDASTNAPALADGAGNPDEEIGSVYRVSVAGTQDLGSGNITFDIGDYVILNDSKIFEKADTTDSVVSVNSQTGIVSLDTDAIAEGTNLYFTDTRARTAAVDDVIVDGVTNVAPSQNAVFDALANKADTSLSNLTGPTNINQDLIPQTGVALSVDNLTGRTEGGSFAPSSSYAVKFTAGSNYVLSKIVCAMRIFAIGGTYAVRIYSDASVPTTLLATSDSFVPGSTGALADVDFNFSTPYTLTNGTTYWIALAKVSGGGTAAMGALNSSVIATSPKEFSFGTWNVTPSKLAFAVHSVLALKIGSLAKPWEVGYTNKLLLVDADQSNSVGFKSPATVAADLIFELPGTDGTSGQVLSTDGAGVLSWVQGGVGTTPNVEYITLSAGDITAKQVPLAAAPYSAAKTILDVIAGGPQLYSTDYTVSAAVLDWTGLGLDGVLIAGDVLRVVYWT